MGKIELKPRVIVDGKGRILIPKWLRDQLQVQNDTLNEAFCFTSDATREFKDILRLYFQLLEEETCCTEIEIELRRKMSELIDKLLEEGKGFAATAMHHDRESLACHRHRDSNISCPIVRFIHQCFNALTFFQQKTFVKKDLSYVV